MRIGIDCRSLTRTRTGIHSYLYNLLRHIQFMDTKNDYVLFFDTPHFPTVLDDGFYKKIYVPCPLVRQQVGKNWAAPLWLNFALPRVLKKERIDVAFYPNFLAPLWGRTRRVTLCWDMSAYSLHREIQTLWRAYVHIFLHYSVRSAEQIIAPSYHAKKELVRWLSVDKSKIVVIYPAIDPCFKIIMDTDILEGERTRLGIGKRFILYLGTLTARKNVISLVKAYSLLRQRGYSDVQLLLAGSGGWGVESIRAKIGELGLRGDVKELGQVAQGDLVYLYNLSTVFAFPSVYEGFGLPVLESMSCGTPVVASNATSLPEVIGDAGLLVDPQDLEGWAEALYRVIVDEKLRNDLREKGMQRAGQFSWEKTARETVAILTGRKGSLCNA